MLRIVIFIALLGIVLAENGSAGWLRYSRLPSSVVHNFDPPSRIITLNASSSSPVYSAGKELENGFKGLFGKDSTHLPSGCGTLSSIIVGTLDSFTAACGPLRKAIVLEVDGFWLSTEGHSVHIIGQNERGALYGTFEYLSMLTTGNFSKVSYVSNPSAPVRWTNEWDNMDGTIERDQQRFKEVLHQLTFQAGPYEWRIEAESMILDGYKMISPNPPESASNFSLVTTVPNSTRATAKTKLQVNSGVYDIVVVCFDISGGVAKWEAHLDNRLLGKWQGDNEYTLSHAATQEPDGGSKTRITFNDVHVNKGDTLEIVGVGDGWDTAPLDYVAVSPRGTMD